MSILAICPSRNRPRQAAETLESFLKTRRDKHSRLVFVVDSDDVALPLYPREYTHVVKPTGKMGGALALAVSNPSVMADATSAGMIGDDNRFRTPGWDKILDGWLTSHVGIAYPDDDFQHERLPTNWWLSRRIVDVFGMAHPALNHLYMDNYWMAMGEGAKCIRYFPYVLIEHLHPLAGKAPNDEIYDRASSPTNIDHDKAFFYMWKKQEWRKDVAKLKKLVGPPPNVVNVLADYHHPALYESLSILFEDRFGWRLFRPIGPEWKKENYWTYSNLDMKLDWPQFLAVNEPRKLADGYYLLKNNQYPGRSHKGVTLYQARAMSWNYIVASVSQNQHAFSNFAAEQKAVFVHQIGNAQHAVDWSLPGRYLASTTMDVSHQPAVTYHQEFDSKIFRYEPPSKKSKIIANFSLRFNWLDEPYKQFLVAQKMAPEFEWRDYGSLYGDIVDQAKVADSMRESAFIWHDKPMGDGYGHVIHNAASVGRPLIGHASYYRGRMAELFWRDMETCIDLDKHNLKETITLIRKIVADHKQHKQMCFAMAETFRKNIDFDDEAQKIKLLLNGELSGDYYDEDYFVTGRKSSYKPYGPGSWANVLIDMIDEYLSPRSLLDVGCAYGFIVDGFRRKGIDAYGFDISPFAVSKRVSQYVQVGSADDPDSYHKVDVILAAELGAHLSLDQASAFMRISKMFGQQMLLLISVDNDPAADGRKSAIDRTDLSHVNIRPMWWWKDLAINEGWKIGNASRFNSDQRSRNMQWTDRFLLLENEAHIRI